MKIFALDTSTEQICLAYCDNKNTYSASYSGESRHIVKLAPMIESFSKLASINFEEVDVLACGIGPGSLTGLRIGIATVQGIACAFKKKIVPVVSSKILAMNFIYHVGDIVVVKHAREGFVYFSCYRKGEEMVAPRILSVQEAIETVSTLENPIFVGDAKDFFKNYGEVVPSELEVLRGELLLKETLRNFEKNLVLEPHQVEPMYLQKSIAEMNLEKRLKG